MIFFYFFILNIFIQLFFSKLAFYLKILDIPDSRKTHKGLIPLTGGLAIYFSIFLFLFFFEVNNYFKYIFYISFIILFLGFLDDLYKLRVSYRLFFQSLVAIILIDYGLVINDLGKYGNLFIDLNYINLSLYFSILSVLVLTNAVNFIDGIDCLVTSIMIFFLVTIIFYIKLLKIDIDLFFIYLLIISLVTFLFFNLNGKYISKIFLGDAGSTFIGFICGFILIYITNNYNNFHPILAAWSVSFPIFNFIYVLLDRLSNKRNPFLPDKVHLHHILINLGIPHKKVVILITFIYINFSILGGITYFIFGPTTSLIVYLISYILYHIIINKFLIKNLN